MISSCASASAAHGAAIPTAASKIPRGLYLDIFKRVEQVVVKVSERKGNDAHVVSGIKAGDEVVMSGQVRLSNGAKVKIVQDQGLKVPDQAPML